jgi:hypothetical protein
LALLLLRETTVTMRASTFLLPLVLSLTSVVGALPNLAAYDISLDDLRSALPDVLVPDLKAMLGFISSVADQLEETEATPTQTVRSHGRTGGRRRRPKTCTPSATEIATATETPPMATETPPMATATVTVTDTTVIVTVTEYDPAPTETVVPTDTAGPAPTVTEEPVPTETAAPTGTAAPTETAPPSSPTTDPSTAATVEFPSRTFEFLNSSAT